MEFLSMICFDLFDEYNWNARWEKYEYSMKKRDTISSEHDRSNARIIQPQNEWNISFTQCPRSILSSFLYYNFFHMAHTTTYLNFPRETEEVFNFYKSVFGGEFEWPISRFGEIPPDESMPPVSENDKDLVMHICLPILGGHKLMGSDAPESMGFTVKKGNNVYIMLVSDTRAEADRLFWVLSEGWNIEMPMGDMFWWDYFGSFMDKYGIGWMISCSK